MRRKERSIWPGLRGSATAIEDGFVTYQITSRTGEKAAVQSAQAPVNPSDRLRCKPGTPFQVSASCALSCPQGNFTIPASRFGRRLGCCA